jgi:hypothetical protein
MNFPDRLLDGLRTTALISDIIASLHFADDSMQQAGSDHFVLAKPRRDVLKERVTVRYRDGPGGFHQPGQIVVGQSQLQLVERGHSKLHDNRRMLQTRFGSVWWSLSPAIRSDHGLASRLVPSVNGVGAVDTSARQPREAPSCIAYG